MIRARARAVEIHVAPGFVATEVALVSDVIGIARRLSGTAFARCRFISADGAPSSKRSEDRPRDARRPKRTPISSSFQADRGSRTTQGGSCRASAAWGGPALSLLRSIAPPRMGAAALCAAAPSSHHRSSRPERTRLLLGSTDRSVPDIAPGCGFTGTPHSSRVFTDRYGAPPFVCGSKLFAVRGATLPITCH